MKHVHAEDLTLHAFQQKSHRKTTALTHILEMFSVEIMESVKNEQTREVVNEF